jgi:acyl-CoA thioesterase-1
MLLLSFLTLAPRSYGSFASLVQVLARMAIAAAVIAAAFTAAASTMPSALAAEQPVKMVALGDSLTAGNGLAAKDAFPAKLEKALAAKGIAVTITNAGVSGDTAANGLARLDWSVAPGTDAVIVELGANDMLRGMDPKVTRKALDEILRRLTERKLAVLLAGMKAAPNFGPDYGRQFESIYTDLAVQYDVPLYPFFLEGVAGDASLNLRDGLHPTAGGVDRIVAGVLPKAEELVERARAKRAP